MIYLNPLLSFFLLLSIGLSPGALSFLAESPIEAPSLAPPAESQTKDTTIYIKAVGGLQYDMVRFKVAPGTNVTLVLENTDDMAHNLLITQPKARLEVVQAALTLGAKGPEMNYVPASPKVLWSIKVLNPGQKQTLTFTAPAQEGVYPYVCTYPGHGFIMYGAMHVTRKPLPPLADDPNIPPDRANDQAEAAAHQGHDSPAASPHPYELKLPAMYRTFMPDCSPAAIAVGLPGGLSYCWDAGTCRLRYAWKGGFVDNAAHWKGNGNALSNVVGEIYYRDQAGFPLRLGDPANVPTPKFKGYRLLDRYPQFEYSIDGVEIKELIKPLEGGTGLVREFQVEQVKEPLYFVVNRNDGVSYQASQGKWTEEILRIPAGKARNFTITMTETKGEATLTEMKGEAKR